MRLNLRISKKKKRKNDSTIGVRGFLVCIKKKINQEMNIYRKGYFRCGSENRYQLLFSGPESLKMGFGHRELELLTEGREGTKKKSK